ncbi:threonine--tRNA ligase [Patescibacteria group bacterium]|nr:threonine--tRNA ligase [Patescibacteria group bacterium]
MNENSNINTTRHSIAHVLMQALERLYEATPGVGPAIEDGFYHDFKADSQITIDNLGKIEKEMRKIIAEKLEITKTTLPIKDGIKLLEEKKYALTQELANGLKEKGELEISFYTQGEFVNMCLGPHLGNTAQINPEAFKLTKVAGAYWKGSEKNEMLQRIYGVAFDTKEELEEYLERLKDAEQRDHRVVAEKQDLFMISEQVGKGLPIWLPNGAFIRKKLEEYMYNLELENGYSYVYTPVLTHKNLYEKSGHLAHYGDDMYSPMDIEGEEYYLKPMNCPHHHMIYKHKPISYRDLPLRLADFGLIHRFERSGVLTGLIRARCFSQNDAHIYCQKSDLKKEMISVLGLFKQVYSDFNIEDFWYRLSLPDFNDHEKYGDIQDKEMWNEAAAEARGALQEFGAKFVEGEGEAAFYGPKIDVQTRNVLGKEDTIATIQVDFYSPKKFNLTFTNKNGEKEHPVIIHRAIMGSFDRFFAYLTEKTTGAFPIWLCPTQVKIVPVGESHVNYSNELAKELKSNNIRVAVDGSSETVGNKIRKAVNEKVPYMLVVGDKEIGSDSLVVRDRGSRDTREISQVDFIKEIEEKVKNKE